jgi:hypothetical protein
MACVQDAACHISPWQHGRFQQQFAEVLHGKDDIGDGELARMRRAT